MSYPRRGSFVIVSRPRHLSHLPPRRAWRLESGVYTFLGFALKRRARLALRDPDLEIGIFDRQRDHHLTEEEINV